MGSREPADRGRERTDRHARDGRPERRARTSARQHTAPAGKIARLAIGYVAEMTGKDPEQVVSLEQTDDGDWLVGVEVVETHRVPDSTDILAVYEAELDPEGELEAYRRVKRYSRCQVGER